VCYIVIKAFSVSMTENAYAAWISFATGRTEIMTSSYRRLVLNPFVVLLLLVAMVFATAADAAACGGEVAPENAIPWTTADAGHAASESDQDQDDTGAPAEQHGMCAHGHCHHGASFAGEVQKYQLSHPAVILAPSAPVIFASDVSDRVKRPPRT
jgi:hypothetical protein